MIDARKSVQVSQLTPSIRTTPSSDWDAYVHAQPFASTYHLSGWTLIAKEVFGHEVFFVETRDAAGLIRGVLPLVRQKSLVFGDFATSIPFFNYGGALGDSEEIAYLMMDHARKLVSGLGCSYLEFRDVQQRQGEWLTRMDKVSMILDLPESVPMLSKLLGAKLRSQAKRADREDAAVRVGGKDLLGDFYQVFCHNMRDLGTPVYSRRFFQAILDKFPEKCILVVVDRAGQPVAAAFLIVSNQRAEIPWAACRADAKPQGFNMKLYWEALGAVVDRGCRVFDFGRSTVDSGTYFFKKQWGARPVQLYWHRWERDRAKGNASEPLSAGRLMRYATNLWQHLPISVANTLGPFVSPSLPW
jgi:FemAB-related protein (PEP-CTERM system-associated)